jgi:tubulin-specific chaperone A
MPLSPLKIKTNVVKRYDLTNTLLPSALTNFFENNSIYKEHLGYGKEAETQQNRINKLIADGADEADVRKQVSVDYK